MSIHNIQSNSHLKTLVSGSTSGFWIGASDIRNEGNFTWSDNSTFDFRNWPSTQPDSHGGNQDCVRLHPTEDFSWDDDNCENKQRYICSISGKSSVTFLPFFKVYYHINLIAYGIWGLLNPRRPIS